MNRHLSAAAMAGLLALAACTPPQGPVSRIDRVKAGDNLLSCEQIKADIAEMDTVLQNSVGAQQQAESDRATTGTVNSAGKIAGSYAGVGNVTGMLGIFGGQMQNDQASQQMQAAQDADDAKARKENLIALANVKNCYAAPAAAKPKKK